MRLARCASDVTLSPDCLICAAFVPSGQCVSDGPRYCSISFYIKKVLDLTPGWKTLDLWDPRAGHPTSSLIDVAHASAPAAHLRFEVGPLATADAHALWSLPGGTGISNSAGSIAPATFVENMSFCRIPIIFGSSLFIQKFVQDMSFSSAFQMCRFRKSENGFVLFVIRKG